MVAILALCNSNLPILVDLLETGLLDGVLNIYLVLYDVRCCMTNCHSTERLVSCAALSFLLHFFNVH